MLDHREGEGEGEEPSHVGRCRRQKGSNEPQAAVEKGVELEEIDGYKPRRDATLTAIPQAGTLQGLVPSHCRKLGVCCPRNGGLRGK